MRLMIAIAIVFLTILLLTGLSYRPARVGPDFIDPVRVETNPVCSERTVQCVTHGDCDRCQDGNVFEMKCQDLINPNVCRGGTFTFPKNSKRGPRPEDCECPPSTFRIVTEGNVPMCIKRNKTSCFDDDTCRQFYSSL